LSDEKIEAQATPEVPEGEDKPPMPSEDKSPMSAEDKSPTPPEDKPPVGAELWRSLRRLGIGAKRGLKALVVGLLVQHWISFEIRSVPSLAGLIVGAFPYSGWLAPYLADPLAFYCLVASILIMSLPWMMISKRWQPELEPAQRSTLSRIFSYLKPHTRYVVGVAVSIVASSLLDLAPAWIIGIILLGSVIPSGDLPFLPVVVMLLAGVFVGKQIASYMKDYLSSLLGQKTIHTLRSDAYAHIEHLPVRFFDSARTGDLISRVVNDTNEMEKVLTEDIANLAANAVVVAGAIALLFAVNARSALLVVPVCVLVVVVVNSFKKAIKRASTKIRRAVAELTAKGFEVLSGIRIVKSFRMEGREAREFRNRSVDIARAKVKLARLSAVYGSTVDLLTGATLLVVIWFTVPSIVSQPTREAVMAQAGALYAFLQLLDKLFKPLVQLSKVNITLQKAIAAADRVFELMDLDPEVKDPSSGLSPATLEGRIEFDHVSFGYRATQKVLENFSLVIEPGETVAVVGSSGAGKSTVVNLLLRFYDPTEGKILIGGFPLDALNLGYLRSKIGLVLQEPVLFSGTIRENIGFGTPTPTHEDIIQAAQLAHAHEFIAALPKGYDTDIGERGVTLSVGQRQRISIARALMKNPSILILDEATSNIDSESESLIKDALDHLAGRRTIIVIGHRLSSIMDADRIVVLAEGGIVEVGTHDDLIGKGGTYSRLYEAQIERGEPRDSLDEEMVEEDTSAR
jgi:subfamily B ATP-binding cassette protein MsbA